MWPDTISKRAKYIISFLTPLLAIYLLNHSSLPLRCVHTSPANAAVYLLTIFGAREFLLMLYRLICWYRNSHSEEKTARKDGESDEPPLP